MALTAAEIADLESARANFVTELKKVSLTPGPDYTVGNQTFQKGTYLKQLRDAIKEIDDMLSSGTAEGPWEFRTLGH